MMSVSSGPTLKALTATQRWNLKLRQHKRTRVLIAHGHPPPHRRIQGDCTAIKPTTLTVLVQPGISAIHSSCKDSRQNEIFTVSCVYLSYTFSQRLLPRIHQHMKQGNDPDVAQLASKTSSPATSLYSSEALNLRSRLSDNIFEISLSAGPNTSWRSSYDV